MARKHQHEDHVNHEAWAIPYGDLVTLLLAFFVVMYAVSSVNEGKYRVLSDSLVAAFRGQPHTMEPIQIGDKLVKVKQDDTVAGIRPSQMLKLPDVKGLMGDNAGSSGSSDDATRAEMAELRRIATDLELALEPLIEKDLIIIKRDALWIEVEIKTDILFGSGSADIAEGALEILAKLAAILEPFPYLIRVEGHTDNVPIATLQFPSNWELSAARAARIIRLFEGSGIAPARMMIAGLGEHQPVTGNDTPEGRNRNRRVALVVLGTLAGIQPGAARGDTEQTAAITEVQVEAPVEAPGES